MSFKVTRVAFDPYGTSSCYRLDYESLRILSNPPATELLFPNLTTLSLTVGLEDPHWFQDSIEFVSRFSPNVNYFALVMQPDITFTRIGSSCIRQWQNLQTVCCPLDALDMDALEYLSRMPTLTHLELSLSPMSPIPDSPPFFPNLRTLTLRSNFCDSVSQLLSGCRLPAITDLTVTTTKCPSRQEIRSLWTSVQTSGASHTIQDLKLERAFSWMNTIRDREHFLLEFEDLWPCTAFSNLRNFEVNMLCNVGLTDDGLITLASAWPRLERLSINVYAGWNTPGGITPNGLLRLLQACPSLTQIALVIDTRGYAELPPGAPLASTRLTKLPRTFHVNVLDSIIELESVLAVATFFAGIVPCADFSFSAWCQVGELVYTPDWVVYKDRWDEVARRTRDTIRQRS